MESGTKLLAASVIGAALSLSGALNAGAADGDLELAVLLAQGIDAETAKTLIRRKP